MHVQVTDPDGASDTASTTVAVANVAPSFSALSSAPAAPENSPVGISGTLTDPGWLDPLTATVNWGDGTPVQPVSGVLENTRPDATLTFTALHTYGDDGSFVAQVCGSDDDTSTCQPVTVTISNVGPTAAIDKSGATIINGVPVIIGHSGSPVTFSGRTQDPGSDDLAATWHWGDGTPDTTTPYLNNPPFLDPHPSPTINPRNVTDTHTHTFGTACFYTSTFRSADDDSGLSPADSVNVVIVGNATDRLKANEWMDEFGKRTKPKLFSDAQLNCYLAIAGFVSSVFNEQRDASTIPAAYIVLKHDQPPLSQPLRDLDQELLAAWLNVANGSIGIGQLIDTDKNHQVDTPFSTVIANAEAVRNNPSSTDKQLHDQSDLLHRVNLGNA